MLSWDMMPDKDYKSRIEAMTPEFLYESILTSKRVCLVCAQEIATSALLSGSKVVVPLCKNCSFGWNFYSYNLFKSIKFKTLIWKLVKFKMFHWQPSIITILRDCREFARWSVKMKKLKRMIKNA